MARRRHQQVPAYPLFTLQRLVRAHQYVITTSAFAGAEELFWDEEDIVECVLALVGDDFEQSYESHQRPGTFQDVYKPRFHGYRLYVKLGMVRGESAIVITFKWDTSA